MPAEKLAAAPRLWSPPLTRHPINPHEEYAMTNTNTRTLAQLAREALNVQDACNLCGVAHGFARAMSDLDAYTRSTDERNTHPIAVLWADKIAQLTGTQHLGQNTVMRAYDAVYKLVG